MSKFIKFFLCFLCIFCLANSEVRAETGMTQEAYELYYKSHQEYLKQDYDSAINYINEALKLSPNNYDLTYKLGIYYISKPKPKPNSTHDAELLLEKDKDLLQAVNAFKKAIEINPARWEAYIATARIYDGLDMFPIAIMWYDKGLAQPNITPDIKAEYTKYKEELIKRQESKESKSRNDNAEVELNIPLDMSKWYKATFNGNSQYWLAEYGLIGEDVMKYQWTKLFSIHFFGADNFGFDNDFAYNYMMQFGLKRAEEIGDNLNNHIISKDAKNLYYEWSIPKLNESEIARIYSTDKGVYLIRYTSKQPNFSEKEKSAVLDLLKKVQ